MRALDRVRGDWRVVRALARGMPGNGAHRDRLQSFYRDQADDYDRFRERLLGGRDALVTSLGLDPGASVLELGAGTGANIGRFPESARRECRFVLVDLCPALLAKARERHAGQANVRVIESAAADFDSPQRFDVVLLSYALTMMPDYAGVITNAERLLKPGGRIAVVDFYLATPGGPARARHGLLQRTFWSRWFAHDGVLLDAARLEALARRFPDHELVEARQPVPWMPGFSVPYFRFVGRKHRGD